MDTQELYNFWEEMNDRKYKRLKFLDDEWQYFFVCEAKKKFPKKKIATSGKARELFGEETSKQMMEPWIKEFHNISDRYNGYKKRIEEKLKVIARDYEIVPYADTMFVLKTRYSSDYRSQGWGAEKYAKDNLMPDMILLRTFGYVAEIKEANRTEYNVTYELKSNITPMDFQMLRWRGEFISVLNWATIHWRNNANPMVYYPWLSNEDRDKSLILSRIGTYQITKDNMKLEPSMEEVMKLEAEWKSLLQSRSRSF